MKICPTCGLRYPNDATNCFVDRAKLEEAPDPFIGQLLKGQYRVEGQIGEGGMATVYRARHTLQDNPVAIKIFRKELARDPKLRERFRREATSTSRLAHPNIIEILDSGEAEDGSPFLVMEMLVGESLEGLLSRGRLPLPRAVDIVLQVLGALARAHDFQVIHRDLKPDNLFVCRAKDGSDHIKILDFGIARSMHDPRLTGTGEVFGTPQYMAPERISSIDAGPAADLYAMGVILYEVASGKLPFEADDITGYLLKHLRDTPPSPRSVNPEIPQALETLILKLLEKDPAKRPVDAHAVVKELTAIAATMPRPKPAPVVPEAVPTPYDGVKRPAAGTLAPATLERWERRMMIFGQMLSRVQPPRPEHTKLLDGVRNTLASMNEVRQRSMREQMKLESVSARAKDAQTRFGRAMDALGVDLSRAREESQRAKDLERQYAEHLKHGSGPFSQVHAKILASPPVPSQELLGLYRAAAQAIEQALSATTEHGRATAYLQAKEREVTDTEFQIQELRAQLDRLSQTAEEEKGLIQKQVEVLGIEMAKIEKSVISDASTLANALRGRPELRELFAELEADAA